MPSQTATVRMFGPSHMLRKDFVVPSETQVSIPSDGCAASTLARELDLPLEEIEAVFVNHQIYSLDHCVQPGDRVAFVPHGISGSARGLLDVSRTGQSDKTLD